MTCCLFSHQLVGERWFRVWPRSLVSMIKRKGNGYYVTIIYYFITVATHLPNCGFVGRHKWLQNYFCGH